MLVSLLSLVSSIIVQDHYSKLLKDKSHGMLLEWTQMELPFISL